MEGFMIALLLIYVLLAIPFGSYLQPFIVMSAIPFGVVGAVWGHIFMGMDLSIMSMFGIVALAGVVINDSLVLVDVINRERKEGHTLMQAISKAGVARFRPIILTSVTTFAGLTPLLLEQSPQAQMLIPMAVSLAFGVMFGTFITLILVPVIYYSQEDVKGIFRRMFGKSEPELEEIELEM
jgi:multidrug efflux pump subunit AcrB